MLIGSMEGQDLALILGTIIGGLGALAAFVTAMFRIAKGVAQINRAVNHAEPGEPTLRDTVIAIDERCAAIERRFDGHDQKAQQLKERVVLIELDQKTRHLELVDAIAKLDKGVRAVGARVGRVEQDQKTTTPRRAR